MSRRTRHNTRQPPAGTWLLGGVCLSDHWREATVLAFAGWTIRHRRGLGVLTHSASTGI